MGTPEDEAHRDRDDTDSTDALAGALSALSVQQPVADSFEGVGDTMLPFTTILDLGVFVWHTLSPSASELKSHAGVTANDVLKRLDVDDIRHGVVLPTDVPMLRLGGIHCPVTFEHNLRRQTLPNRFPNNPGVAAALAAASIRGLGELPGIDFVLGGSGLGVLAQGDTNRNVYLLQRVGKGGETIVLAKHSEYNADLTAKGFQFERLVTGERMAARANEDTVIGMQLVQLGPFKVLFHAEVDALDVDTERSTVHRVEIKSGNPQRFGPKEMYQMVSSRSSELVFARCQGDRIVDIRKVGLDEVAGWTPLGKRRHLASDLLWRLKQLKELPKDQLSKDQPSQLMFDDEGVVRVQGRPELALLPTPRVVAELLEGVNGSSSA